MCFKSNLVHHPTLYDFRSSSLRKTKSAGDETNKSCAFGTKISSSRTSNGSKVKAGVVLLKEYEQAVLCSPVYICMSLFIWNP